MSCQPLRIGFLGAGANTRTKHIPGLRAISGVTLASVANRSAESSARVAQEFGIKKIAKDWREIVMDPEIDAVCIGTWPYLHAEVTMAALEAGKHVLTEARMACDLSQARQMLAVSQARPTLVAQIVPAPMSLPYDAAVMDILAAGVIGSIREAFITATNGALVNTATPMTWRQDFALSGKNTLMLGIYYEMVRRWLRRDPVNVSARAAVFTRLRPDTAGVMREIVIPDSVTLLGDYADGARLVGHFSGVETVTPRSEIRLNGEKGGLRLDLAKGELWLAERGQKERRVEVPTLPDDGWRVEADFVESIREGRAVRLTDFATGVRYMAVTEAVWDSWNRDGATVSVPA